MNIKETERVSVIIKSFQRALEITVYLDLFCLFGELYKHVNSAAADKTKSANQTIFCQSRNHLFHQKSHLSVPLKSINRDLKLSGLNLISL